MVGLILVTESLSPSTHPETENLNDQAQQSPVELSRYLLKSPNIVPSYMMTSVSSVLPGFSCLPRSSGSACAPSSPRTRCLSSLQLQLLNDPSQWCAAAAPRASSSGGGCSFIMHADMFKDVYTCCIWYYTFTNGHHRWDLLSGRSTMASRLCHSGLNDSREGEYITGGVCEDKRRDERIKSRK